MGDLKPCPCGSTRVEDAMRTGAIECIDCGFSAPTRRAWNTRATPPEVAALVETLRRWQVYGCPDCGGDCSSANPPVSLCIMVETRDALAKWGAAQK